MKRGTLLRSSALVACVALTAAGCHRPGGAPAPAPPVQGWDATYRNAWYEATQGSRLMPLSWFQALEQPGAKQPFMDEAFLSGFRMLPSRADRPIRLPVGMAIDNGDDSQLVQTRLRWFDGQGPTERWVGLNCAACHTAELNYGGKTIRVDGGPSLFDFQRFIEALDTTLTQTRDQPAKWDRFAGKVLAGRDTPGNRHQLKAALGSLIDWQDRARVLNERPANDTPMRYGYGRVDAFGHIFNKIALFVGAEHPMANPADAPVSYPHLWNIHKETHLQWDGIATNARISLGPGGSLDYGALGRNTGEVIGVFGEVVVGPKQDLTGYPTSAQAGNLIDMEEELTHLQSPAWPAAILGPIDQVKVTAGQALFTQHCASCHTPKGGNYEQMVTLKAMGDENRTDGWMACNAVSYQTYSGLLNGGKTNYLNGDPIPPVTQTATLLAAAVKGALVAEKGPILASAAQTFIGVHKPPTVVTPFALVSADQRRRNRLTMCLGLDDPLMAYKARPLEGIWATGPYLHNGSVPTLNDLLLAPSQRPKTFYVGTRNFDPQAVGLATDKDAPGNAFLFDTSILGNSNAGHDYGASGFTPAERASLLEYLKSL